MKSIELNKKMCCTVCGKDKLEWAAHVDEFNNVVERDDYVFCNNCEGETKAVVKSEYKTPLTDKELYEVGLLAVTGDMSRHGMGDKSEFIRFDYNHINLVENYLNKCIKHLIRRAISNDFLDAMKDENDAYQNLRDVSVFGHKYQARTSWFLSPLKFAFNDKDIYIIDRRTLSSRLALDKQYKD
jgi:hypothetical protein